MSSAYMGRGKNSKTHIYIYHNPFNSSGLISSEAKQHICEREPLIFVTFFSKQRTIRINSDKQIYMTYRVSRGWLPHAYFITKQKKWDLK